MRKKVANNQAAIDIYAWLAANVGPMGKIDSNAVNGRGWRVKSIGNEAGHAIWNIEFDCEEDEVMFALRWI